MAIINTKLIKYATQARFDIDIAKVPAVIDSKSIVFVEDTGRIYAHGKYFGGAWGDISNKPTTFTPSAHTHGNITNDGKIGTATDKIIETSTGGLLVAVAKNTAYNRAFGVGANQVAMGNHTHAYLPLSGGTLSGTLNSTTSNIVPAIYKTTSTGTAVLRIGATTYDKGFGLGNHGELIFGDWSAVGSLSSAWDKLWHSGHFTQTDINNWNSTYNWGNHSSAGYALAIRNITAGNGLTGGGNLTANRTITLGTPSAITALSSNGVSAQTHTHLLQSSTVDLNTGLNTDIDGFVSGSTGSPISGSVMGTWTTLRSNTAFGSGFFARANQAWFRTRESGVMQGWNEIYHTGNLTNLSQLNNNLPNFTRTVAGLVPAPGAATVTRYLREDGAWIVPPNTADTHWVTGVYVGAVTTKTDTTVTNPYIKIFDNDTNRGNVQIIGGTNVTVSSNSSKAITINSSYTNTEYLTNTLAHLNTGEDTVGKLQTAKNLHDWLSGKGYATESYVDNIEIGGRNLLLNTKNERSGSYNMSPTYILTEKPIVGESYTLSGWFKLPEGKLKRIMAYNSGGSIGLFSRTDSAWQYGEWFYFSITFTWSNVSGSYLANDTSVNIYCGASDGLLSYAKLIKLEKGNKATDWTPAPEDQVTDWNVTDVNSFAFLKNKPTKLTLTGAVTGNTTLSSGELSLNTSLTAHTHTWAQITGTIPTWNQSTTGNAATASAVSTSAENTGTTSRYILFADNASGNQALKTDTGLKYVSSTNTISANISGNLSGGTVNGTALGVTNVSASTGLGLSLYGGPTTGIPQYGMTFAGTPTFGTHGAVTGDWATYFTMTGATSRGWIFKLGTTNVASISAAGVITAPTFIGALSGKATSAGTADTAANATKWASQGYSATQLTTTPTYLMGYDGSNWRPLSNNIYEPTVSSYSFTKSLQLSTTWQDTGIGYNDIPTGTYAFSVYSNNAGMGGGNYSSTFSGVISWYSGGTNSTTSTKSEEIIMQGSGHHVQNHIYIRTSHSASASGTNLRLQIATDVNTSAVSSYIFKFKQII